MSGLQIGFLVFFIAVALFGLLVFSGIIPKPGGDEATTQATSSLLMWGSFEKDKVLKFIDEFNSANRGTFRVSYKEVPEEMLEIELLRAISAGTAPDLLLFPHDLLHTLKEELVVIPPESLNTRQFLELFIEGGELFVGQEGIYAVPILVDPLVMYWNRDIVSTERIAQVPKTWPELLTFAKTVTKKDQRGKILQSAVALGESRNINHFKEIVSLFFLQVGDSIVVRNPNTGRLNVVLGQYTSGQGSDVLLTDRALSFYTDFADSIKPHYSWNASFLNSLDTFTSGNLALYFGPASDLSILMRRNPHLNFDIAPVPQLSDAGNAVNFGKIYGIGVVNKPKINKKASFSVLFGMTITSNEFQEILSQGTYLPPAKRILLQKGSTDTFLALFYREAIISKGWIDPNPGETKKMFSDMINVVVARSKTVGEAISDTNIKISDILKQ
jgi:ABC-type glycerol-3-phosphate transport system substrate-binding protein